VRVVGGGASEYAQLHEARAAFKAALVELFREHSPVPPDVQHNRRRFLRYLNDVHALSTAMWRNPETTYPEEHWNHPKNAAHGMQIPYEIMMAIHALCFPD
jgi:hypothetical protein